MSHKHHHTGVSKVDGARQVEPWIPTLTLTFQFFIVGHRSAPFLKLAVTGKNPRLLEAGSAFAQRAEYWSHFDASLVLPRQGQQVIAKVAGGQPSSSELSSFFGDMVPKLCLDQTSPEWQAGHYEPEAGVKPFLFSVETDPEAPGTPLGLVLLVNDAGDLVGVSWHRTQNPGDGVAWQVQKPGDYSVTFLGATADASLLATPDQDWWYVRQPTPA